MNFRTSINKNEIKKPASLIDYQSKIGLFGSCFVENIGEKLNYYKFDNFVNPYGILFNPIAIERALEDIYTKKVYTKDDLTYHNNLWHSLHHHSDYSTTDSSMGLEKINQIIRKSHKELLQASHLIITLGTAWVYHHKTSNQFVANCHKIPQTDFTKKLLSVDEIKNSLHKSLYVLKKMNPNIQVVFTLSPIRHLKDGMIANSRSKASLLTAIHEVVEDTNSYYFPSYEIQMDDLRAYRFYTADMIHPNETAINYIWDLFKEIWINKNDYPIMGKVDEIQKATQHKAFNKNSIQHVKFIEKLEGKKDNLQNKYGISF